MSQSFQKRLKAYFTRRRLLGNGITTLILAVYFIYFNHTNSWAPFIFGAVAFLYLGFYVRLSLKQRSLSS